MKILLDGNADVDAADDDGERPLGQAIYENRNDIVIMLMEHEANVNAADTDDYSRYRPLNYAALRGNTAVVQALVERGADVNLGTKSNYSPLMHASWYGHSDIVKIFLESIKRF